MENSNSIRYGRHCVFNIHTHLVFVTKYRKDVFDSHLLNQLEELFREVCEKFEAHLEAFNGEKDHVHLLVNYPPKVSISRLVNSLKGVSSRLLKKQNPHLKDIYYQGKLWSPSYFAGTCGGAPLTVIQEYIDSQHTPT